MAHPTKRPEINKFDAAARALTLIFIVVAAAGVYVVITQVAWRYFGGAAALVFALAAIFSMVAKHYVEGVRNRLHAAYRQIAQSEARIAQSEKRIAQSEKRIAQSEKRIAQSKTGSAQLEAMIDQQDRANRSDFGLIDERFTGILNSVETRFVESEKLLRSRASGEALVIARKIADQAKEATGVLKIELNRLERARKAYHVHSRILSETDIEALIKEWATPLGVNQSGSSIRYLADRIISLEQVCAGRLATDIQTMLARVIAAQSIKSECIDIIEIGTLFGIGAGVLYDACRYQYDDVSLTLIDPLEGYYDRSENDIITNVPVFRNALEHNLACMNVPSGAATIIQELSESPAASKLLGDAQFDLLIIDGDHSYDGVKRDFGNFVGRVRPGGLIVFDDYDTLDWPEIKTYVDKEVAPLDGLEEIATGFRTALYRVSTTK